MRRMVVWDNEQLQQGLAVVTGMGPAGQDRLVSVRQVGVPVPGGRRVVWLVDLGEPDPDDYELPVIRRVDWRP